MKFFEDSNALDSLRHSDFDALSAYGEVIDNSIQANAKRISISILTLAKKQGFEQIKTLAFGDDGDGMSLETLHACLKLGWSSRYNDRTGIGRFGVGMVLGAIHEVKKVEVYSKQKDGEWFYTYIDLDEVKDNELEEIPKPKKTKLPEAYKDIAGAKSGTVVVWSKYDRQLDTASKIREEAEHWIGRTFRYFIWDGVDIYLDGHLVPAHDPLRVRTENTKFPDDPPAKAHAPIKIEWPVPIDGNSDKVSEKSIITINTSLLPEILRPNAGSANRATNIERFIEEGISILRNRREVYFGRIPHWGSAGTTKGWKFEEIDRWWGCEVHFDAELDSEFSVKNIKRGAIPRKQLKGIIKDKITPTRESALEEVRRVWNEEAERKRRNENNNDNGATGNTNHTKAVNIAKKTPIPKSNFNSNKTTEQVASELEKNFLFNETEAERAKILALFEAQPFTVEEKA